MKKTVLHPKGVADPQKVTKRDPTGYPWSQAIRAKGELLFVSGQTSIDSDGKVLWKNDLVRQTERCLVNLERVLKSAGGDRSNVVSTIWFVKSADDFYHSGASTVRRRFFKRDFPTSTLVEIKGLADPDLLVEVQAFAVL